LISTATTEHFELVHFLLHLSDFLILVITSYRLFTLLSIWQHGLHHQLPINQDLNAENRVLISFFFKKIDRFCKQIPFGPSAMLFCFLMGCYRYCN